MRMVFESFYDVLADLMRNKSNVVVVECDLGRSSGTAMLQEEFSERYFNVGIAESNAVGLACGLARTGFIPVVHSFAAFLTGRAFEFIKLGAGYHGSNVLLCGTKGGLENSWSGPTHHACDDFALTLAVPLLGVHAPPDFPHLHGLMQSAVSQGGPHYFRIPRRGTKAIFVDGENARLGGVVPHRQIPGGSPLILYTGTQTALATELSRRLAEFGWNPEVVCVSTLSDQVHTQLGSVIGRHSFVITLEEHYEQGGLTSLVRALRPSEKRVLPRQKTHTRSGFSSFFSFRFRFLAALLFGFGL